MLDRVTRMKIFDWLDGIEIRVIGIAAAIFLVLGPVYITYRFVLIHRHGMALITGALWVCCVAACVRDFRRQRLSWISGGVLAIWLATTLILGSMMS